MMSQDTAKKKTDWLSILVTTLALGWIVGVSLVVQASALFAATFPAQIFRSAGLNATTIYFAAALLQVVALLLPLLPLARFWRASLRASRYRAAFRAWCAATLFVLALSPARLVPSSEPQLALLAASAGALVFAFVLWTRTARGRVLDVSSATATGLAASVGILFMLPWLAWGALGSIGDVIFGILAALSFALATTLVLARVWLNGMFQDTRGAGWDITLGGFVVSALLLVMASAMGFNGTQILWMLALSAFGWAVMGFSYIGRQEHAGWNSRALFVLLALLVGAPLLLLDPDTGILQASLAPGEMLGWALRAVGVTILGAWLIGFVLFLLQRRAQTWRNTRWAWLSALVLAFIGAILYFGAGQPGLYGDRLFVILKEQADVSAARTIGDYDARREFVYRTLVNHANRSQADLRATLDHFGISYTPYYLVNAIQVDGGLLTRILLTTRGDVERSLPAPVMRPLPENLEIQRGDSDTAPTQPEWNLKLIGADRVWNELGVRGQAVVVGQADSGVDGAHPELREQYRGRDGANDYNWFDPWFRTTQPRDLGGHGTHTLGSVLGKNVGVAPGAEWIGCVNLARNLGNPPLYLDCMQFLFAPFPQNGDPLRDGDPRRGAHITNNSWGCPDVEGCDPNALIAAVRALRDAGVFVVASAGNDGPGCSSIKDPLALYDDVFSVGAVDRFKHVADFSSRGPVVADDSGRVKPDIAAPGVNVYSSLPGGTYGENSGTSMAGPHVVGAVALMWSANPKLIGDIARTEQILRETAQRANGSGEEIVCGDPNATPNDFVGYGIVDAYAAVKRALEDK